MALIDIYDAQKEYAYRNTPYNRYEARNQVGSKIINLPVDKWFDFFKDNNFKYTSYGNWSNGIIGIKGNFYPNEPDYWKNCVSNLHSIMLVNMKTSYTLKYEKFELGVYLTNYFYEQCSDWDKDKPKFIQYNIPEDWSEQFFKELSKIVTETTNRINLKNKKEAQADAVQQIENDIDYGILDVADELQEFGIKLEKIDNEINSVTVTYRFSKEIQNLHKNPYIAIRKLKNGKYMMQYKNYEYWSADITTWKQIKDGTTPDQIKQYIRDYFEPWKGMNDVYIKKPTFL